MADKTLDTRLKLKYDTAANWEAENPVLLAGEVGIESDTLLGKVGDGSKAWQQLEYFAPKCKEVTHAELKALRDINGLVPGMFYRITDYNCTTSQENTRSARHAFDIIVKALSNNTLSENASATQHEGGGSGDDSGDDSPQFKPEVLADSEGTLVEGAVVPSYYMFEDAYEMNGTEENYKSRDHFIAYTYMENNDGVVVPVIYKTDVDAAISGSEEYNYPDTQDTFFYDGTMEVDGVVYDKWRKITLTVDSELTWDSDGKVWALTNVVVTTDGNASDPYFENCKLNAWEIKYSLDNDKTRFWWASESGRGVIYYMKDEYGNECPYDFKNIQFKRWQTDDEATNDDKFYSSWDDTGNEFRWCYTFMANGTSNDTWADASTIKPHGFMNNGGTLGCYGNVIKPFIQEYTGDEIENESEGVQWLNNIVMYGTYEDEPTVTEEYDYNYLEVPASNTFGYKCHSNTLKTNCVNNTFGNHCRHNIFGDYCDNNLFGNDCSSNTFGYGCDSNTFGNNCDNNTVGNNSSSSALGDDCDNNVFGNRCTYNTFGNTCNKNTFGDDCNYNTFGNNCFDNNFGNECTRNTFGHGCKRNTVGDNCEGNIFGNDCWDNIFGNYCDNNTIDSRVRMAKPQPTSGSSTSVMKGIHIHFGASGTFTVTRGANYTQDIRKSGSQEILLD